MATVRVTQIAATKKQELLSTKSNFPIIEIRSSLFKSLEEFQMLPWGAHQIRVQESVLMKGITGPFGPFGPRTEITEMGSRYIILMELPSVTEPDLGVTVCGDYLTIEGGFEERRHLNSPLSLSGPKKHHSFRRTFKLSDDVDPEGVGAVHDNGILEVSLPKKPQAKSRRKIR